MCTSFPGVGVSHDARRFKERSRGCWPLAPPTSRIPPKERRHSSRQPVDRAALRLWLAGTFRTPQQANQNTYSLGRYGNEGAMNKSEITSFQSSQGDDGDALSLRAAELITVGSSKTLHNHGWLQFILLFIHSLRMTASWRMGLGCVLTIFCSYLPMYLHRHIHIVKICSIDVISSVR